LREGEAKDAVTILSRNDGCFALILSETFRKIGASGRRGVMHSS